MGGMKRMVVLFGVVALGGCYHYAPVVAADRPAQYEEDLAACQESGVAAVNTRNAKTALSWIASPATRLFQIRAAIRECVRAKGYKEG